MRNALFLLAIICFFGNFNPIQAQHLNISGLTVDSHGTLPGVMVELDSGASRIASTLDGRFVFTNIKPGNHQLLFSYLGYKTIIRSVEVRENTDLGRILLEPLEGDLKEVTVNGGLGQGSQAKAINMIKNSDKILNVMSRETILKLPDRNAAESVARLSGVNVQRNKGEGSGASLRGTPEEWTATLLNGDRLPVADEDNFTRTFEFEVLPSDLVDYIIVNKSNTADIEGDNIGGSINLLTRQSVTERTLNLNLSGGTSLLTQKPSVQGGIMYGDITKNKKFSFVLNGSYYGRYYGAQNYKVVYGNNFNQGINRLELRNYEGFRHTAGANFGFEYAPNDKIRIGGRFLYGGNFDDKYQQRTSYNYSEGSGSTVRLQNIHGLLMRQMFSGEINVSANIKPNLKLTAKVATYHNFFQYGNVPFSGGDDRNGYHVVEFGRFLLGQDGYTDRDYITLNGGIPDTTGGNTSQAFITKLIGKDNPYGHGDPYNKIIPKINTGLHPQDFKFTQAYSQLNKTKERDPIVAQADLKWTANKNVVISFGAKARMKEGSRDISFYQWLQNVNVYTGEMHMDKYNTSPLADHGGFLKELGSPYSGTFMPFLTHNQLNSFVTDRKDSLRGIPMNVTNIEYLDFLGSSYHYKENVYAAYGMGEFKLPHHISINAGIRLEYTSLREYADTISPILTLDTASFTYYYPKVQQEAKAGYLSWLPSFALIYSPRSRHNIKFAFSRSLHRPNFAQTKPGYAQYSIENLEFNFGNPKLRPSYSYNFDLNYEYYWGNTGMLMIGGYYKYVKDHIFASMTADADPSTGIIYKYYQNASTSYVAGLEASISKQFTFLPRFLSGFGIDANIAWSYSTMQVPGRHFHQAMPEQAPLIYNASLFYEKYGLEARLALNYTASYLHELNLAAVSNQGSIELLHQNTDYDLFHAAQYLLDFQANYTFKKHYSVFLNANNLLDTPFVIFRGERSRPGVTEYYRQKFQVGFKFTL